VIEAKARGRADAPYLFVMVSEPSDGMEAWFWRQLHGCGIKKTEVRIVFMLDEPPANAGNKGSVAQFRSARARFERDMQRSSPKVVLPMGTEAFFALTGINEGIFDARGYLIRKDLFHAVPRDVWKQVGTYVNASKATGAKKGDPKMKWVKEAGAPLLGFDFKGTVIPVFTLDHIRTEQFAVKPAFKEDLLRAVRVKTGTLVEIDKDLKFITTIEEVPPLAEFGPVIAVDIETHGVDNEVIDLVSWSDGERTVVLEWTEDARLWLEKMFATKRIFAVHNSPFDIPRLVANGVYISQKVIDEQVFDTMFGAVVVQPDLHKALGRVASLYLDMSPWKTSSRKENSHWRIMVKADPVRYAGKDAFATKWIADSLIAIMKSLGCWNLYMGQPWVTQNKKGETVTTPYPGPGVMATIPELSLMSRGGLRTNRTYASIMCSKLETRLFRYLKLWTRQFPNIKVSSNPQLHRLLYKQWGLPVQRTKEDGVSVDELALVKLKAFVEINKDTDYHPGAWRDDPRANPRTFDLLFKIKKTSKMLGTYVQPVMLGEDTWVHPSYLPASKDDERGGKKMDNKGNTATGRLMSYKPNIQNQMKDIIGGFSVRNLYVPDDDTMCLVEADYKSAELFILAGEAGDQKLLDDLLSGDMHGRNAARFGIPRPTVKNVTYASMYLAGPGKQSDMILEQEHVYVSPEVCLSTSETIWGYYEVTNAYRQLLIELCEKQKYITNAFGRTRFFHDGRAPAAVDFIPQSEVADIIWCVLKPVAEMARRYGGRLVTTVHDSIIICVPAAVRDAAAQEMKAIMERRFDNIRKGFYIPVDLKVGAPGASWGEMKAAA
jgi:DNA polymerase family A/3'-5' exonuclease